MHSILEQHANVPIFEKEMLLAFSTRHSREFIMSHPNEEILKRQARAYARLLKKREAGWSVAHILGKKEFFELNFFVNKHTLIPRPETELLVWLALKRLESTDGRRLTTVIDVGTGSGCISIAIARSMRKSGIYEHIDFFGIDTSRPALRVAKKNAALHDTHITFLHGNLLEPITNKQAATGNENLLITANLPYLTQEQFDEEPSIHREPLSALVAKEGGLFFYKRLLKQLRQIMVDRTPSTVTLFMEIDPSQSRMLSHISTSIFPNAAVATHKDLAGHDRVVEILIDATPTKVLSLAE